MKNIRFLGKNKKGFTLVELVVVIAIMAILGGLVTTTMVAQSRKSDRDQYKQYCLSILETAEDICTAYNKGAKKVAGYDIVNNRNEIDWSAIKDLLNTENINNYKYNVNTLTKGITLLGLIETKDTISSSFTKDTVIIYFKSNGKGEMYAVGCWYFEAGNTTAKYKYDYVKDEFLGSGEDFYTP